MSSPVDGGGGGVMTVTLVTACVRHSDSWVAEAGILQGALGKRKAGALPLRGPPGDTSEVTS